MTGNRAGGRGEGRLPALPSPTGPRRGGLQYLRAGRRRGGPHCPQLGSFRGKLLVPGAVGGARCRRESALHPPPPGGDALNSTEMVGFRLPGGGGGRL